MTDIEKFFARYLFLCADISNYMPDFLAQMTDSVQQDMLDLVFRFANGGNMPFDVPALAERLGAPLIEVLRPTEHTYELRFVHLSIYQYLVDSNKFAKSGKIPALLQARQVSGLFRSAVAVWYFTECKDSALHLQSLQRDDPALGPDYWSACYFPMAYCLWDALKIKEAHLETLSDQLLYEAESALGTLTAFLSTRLCLPWFKLSTIINYAGNFQQLLDRIIEALEIAQKEDKKHIVSKAYMQFNRARLRFFRQWKSIVLRTTPWELPPGRSERILEETHEGATYIDGDTWYEAMKIAQSWSVKLKMFSTDRRGSDPGSTARYMCSKCLGVMSMKDIRKHQMIGRRGRK